MTELFTASDYPVLRAIVRESSAVPSFPHGTVFVFDHDLRSTHVGGEHLTALGRNRPEYVGRPLWEMFDADVLRTADRSMYQVRSGRS